jgi:nitrous oxidase accessory protein
MNKNLIAMGIVGILLFSCFAIAPAFGVSGSGNTLYVGGVGPGNYTKIQDAINAASNGDTVYVYNGIYYENVVVNKTINLVGENRDNTVIDGSGTGDVVTISADWANISGFTIQNSGSGYPNWDAGISILSPDSNNNTIFGNNIKNNNWGVFLNHSSNNAIYKNNIFNNVDSGVLLNDASSNIFGNNITNNNEGLILAFSSNVVVWDNAVKSNGVGLDIYHSSNDVIYGNNITENIAIGIELWELSSNNEIFENNIINNGEDPAIGYGLVIDVLSDNNTIYHNNFVDNKHNASDSCGNIWNIGYPFGGNYWGNYTGIDADHDGIGDTPYNISGGSNKDRYPLMKPFGENLPVADFKYITNNSTVTFTSLSYDRDGTMANYTWNFGDGKESFEQNPTHTYVGEYATYNVTLNVTDNDGRKGTIYKYVTTNDTTPPTIQIIKPERALYMGNHKIRRLFLRMALVIGDITVEVNATDSGSGIAKIEFYINGKLKGNDTTAPYTYNLTKDKLLRFVHMQIIKVVAYDNAGNSAVAKMIVKKYL